MVKLPDLSGSWIKAVQATVGSDPNIAHTILGKAVYSLPFHGIRIFGFANVAFQDVPDLSKAIGIKNIKPITRSARIDLIFCLS